MNHALRWCAGAHRAERWRYALSRRAQHPATVYVRETQIVPPLDDWIGGVFGPERLDETCRALAEAQEPVPVEDGRAEAPRRTIAECDARLARYREALEVGTDPAVVDQWISEVQAERRAAEEELLRRPRAPALTKDDIRAIIERLADLVGVLEADEPAKKATLYESLGLALKYEPRKRRVLVEADLGGVRPVRVGGPKSLNRHPEWRIRPWSGQMTDAGPRSESWRADLAPGGTG